MHSHEKLFSSGEVPTIEKKVVKHAGDPVGELEKHYDRSERVIFEKATDLLTGAINIGNYVYDQKGELEEEIWKDRNGKVARYAHSKDGVRSLIEKDSGFEDIDF